MQAGIPWERPTGRDADHFPASGVAILHLPPARKLPASLRRSLTWDRGLEMAKHKAFTMATNVKVYFCDPQSPSQLRHQRKHEPLPRQYFSKRTDLSGCSQTELDR